VGHGPDDSPARPYPRWCTMGLMTTQQGPASTSSSPGAGSQDSSKPRVLIVGQDGMSVEGGDGGGESVADMVAQPAKVMRIGTMIKQLLDEVKAAPLDEASRVRLTEIYRASIKELEQGLAPDLVDELERLSLPFDAATVPSESELRIAQAQLVGWLEGLFHGIQTALFAQQVAARAQFEHMRRALPSGASGAAGLGPGGEGESPLPSNGGSSGGMYL
jgi:Protein of unknown function (DUF2587)